MFYRAPTNTSSLVVCPYGLFLATEPIKLLPLELNRWTELHSGQGRHRRDDSRQAVRLIAFTKQCMTDHARSANAASTRPATVVQLDMICTSVYKYNNFPCSTHRAFFDNTTPRLHLHQSRGHGARSAACMRVTSLRASTRVNSLPSPFPSKK